MGSDVMVIVLVLVMGMVMLVVVLVLVVLLVLVVMMVVIMVLMAMKIVMLLLLLSSEPKFFSLPTQAEDHQFSKNHSDPLHQIRTTKSLALWIKQ